mmetsp:Transcript_63600/g.99042  ORF Transcript_63600/g.99042 Transcript_63600/m.99042 type:complete len:106 (+) Transcript_63600:1210-1527(+)
MAARESYGNETWVRRESEHAALAHMEECMTSRKWRLDDSNLARSTIERAEIAAKQKGAHKICSVFAISDTTPWLVRCFSVPLSLGPFKYAIEPFLHMLRQKSAQA